MSRRSDSDTDSGGQLHELAHWSRRRYSLIFLLIASLVTNAVVASVCMWIVDPHALESSLTAKKKMISVSTYREGTDFEPFVSAGSYIAVPGGCSIFLHVNTSKDVYPEDINNLSEFEGALPSWIERSRVLREPYNSDIRDWEWRLEARGWPFNSFYCVAEQGVVGTKVQDEWGVRGGSTIHNVESDDRFNNALFIPFRPVWSGFITNTLLYAFGWLVCWLFLKGLLQLRRFRRGVCPTCRNNLEFNYGNGCTVCGWRRMKSIARSTE